MGRRFARDGEPEPEGEPKEDDEALAAWKALDRDKKIEHLLSIPLSKDAKNKYHEHKLKTEQAEVDHDEWVRRLGGLLQCFDKTPPVQCDLLDQYFMFKLCKKVRSIDIPPDAVIPEGCHDLVSVDQEEETFRQLHGLPGLSMKPKKELQQEPEKLGLFAAAEQQIESLNKVEQESEDEVLQRPEKRPRADVFQSFANLQPRTAPISRSSGSGLQRPSVNADNVFREWQGAPRGGKNHWPCASQSAPRAMTLPLQSP
ncbi:unnamed protein product [Symbiodinium sp. KB8]|nr:unnamed protein product [Symbiodinium sp. KB8]